jgi:hypothetical protein
MTNTTKEIEFATEELALAYAQAWCARSVVGATHCYAYVTQDAAGAWWVTRTKSYLR